MKEQKAPDKIYLLIDPYGGMVVNYDKNDPKSIPYVRADAIRAEIERRKNNAETLRERNICIDLLSLLDAHELAEQTNKVLMGRIIKSDSINLDALEEKSEKLTIEQYRAWIISEVEKKFEEAKKNFTEACDSGDALRMFDEAEKDAWESVLRWFKGLHGYDITPFDDVSMSVEEKSDTQINLDLEKELEDFVKSKIPYGNGGYSDYLAIARHFTEFGIKKGRTGK